MDNYYTIENTSDLKNIPYNLWQPNSLTNMKIIEGAKINSNWKYRQYLQKNAKEIIKYNTMQTINSSGNNPYTILNNISTENIPYLYNSIHDTNNPKYGYINSDLKSNYIDKQRIKSRMVAPSISTNF